MVLPHLVKARFIGKVFAAMVSQPTSSVYTAGVPYIDMISSPAVAMILHMAGPHGRLSIGEKFRISLFSVIATPNVNTKIERKVAMLMRSFTKQIQGA